MNRPLSIALDRYDRHVPFFLGQVAAPAGYELKPLEVGMDPPRRDGINRHHRMLVKREFDIAEVSLASYIIGVSRGAAFTAVPAFPRRLFSQNHIFVRRDAGIKVKLYKSSTTRDKAFSVLDFCGDRGEFNTIKGRSRTASGIIQIVASKANIIFNAKSWISGSKFFKKLVINNSNSRLF